MKQRSPAFLRAIEMVKANEYGIDGQIMLDPTVLKVAAYVANVSESVLRAAVMKELQKSA